MRFVRVLTVALALALAVPALAQQQQPAQVPQTCESQLQSTSQYALLLKGARDQAEFSIADLRKQVGELQGRVQDLEKRASLPPSTPTVTGTTTAPGNPPTK